MKFRYDIGFLRAFSVLIVVLFHFKVSFFSGGFLGVDIFFVISGFLMTKIILTGISKNTFSFLKFYLKRFTRIVPALLFLILFVLIISNILFLPSDLRLNAKYSALSSAFLSNIYFWLYSCYFDPSSQTNILLHTWSLSVEWQFYMIYPLLLWPLRNLYMKQRRLFVIIFGVFTLLSFLLMLMLTVNYNSFSFYMFPTRAWEMTLGGLATILSPKLIEVFLKKKIKKIVVIVCYLILVFCTVFIDETMIWPSIVTIVPTIAVFFILFLNEDFKILKNKGLQFVGNTSYSLYLWHWPLYIIFMYFGLTGNFYIILLLVLSFSFSTLSYYFIEKNQFISSFKSTSLVLLFTLGISTFIFLKPNNEISQALSIYDKGLLEISSYEGGDAMKWKTQFNPCDCFIAQSLTYKDYDATRCLTINPDKKNILLLGDSHAAQLSASFREKLPDNFHLSEASASYVFPFVNANGRRDSKFLMHKVFNEFIKTEYKNIDAVIISVHWLMYRNGQLGYNKEGLVENLLNTIQYIESKDIKVVLVGQMESYSIPFPKILTINKTFGSDFTNRYIDEEGKELNEYFKLLLDENVYLDIYNKKIIKFNSLPYMFDDNHLSKFGADQLVNIILKEKLL